MFRIRIHYTKQGALRYTGNLDMQRIWERLVRRAALPLAYSQGFHPQPRINQACPLPLGMTSQAELVDAWLEEEIPCEEIIQSLQQSSPPGMKITSVNVVDLREDSLPILVKSAVYRVVFGKPFQLDSINNAISSLLSSTTCIRERRGKKYDLRPMIEKLTSATGDNGYQVLEMQLSAREAATGRPDEVILALGFEPTDTDIERIGLLTS